MKKIILILLLSFVFSDSYLAILDLEPTGLSDNQSYILTQSLTNKIIESGNYIVVERSNMDKILKEQKFQHSGCTNSECAVEIGQLLNSDYTLIGSVGKFSSTYIINIRLINVETGEVMKSAEYTHKGQMDELLTKGIQSIINQLNSVEEKPEQSESLLSKIYKQRYKIGIVCFALWIGWGLLPPA